MAKKTSQFIAFGVKYRTTQFSAVTGLEFTSRTADLHPCEILGQTDVKIGAVWRSLSDPKVINMGVTDKARVVSPLMVLNGIISLVRDFNFAFIDNWRGVKVPTRFLDQTNSVSSENIDPIVRQLIQDDVATLKELEEYYSMEDAFKLFDTLMVKGINQAIAQEDSMKKSRR